MPEHSPGVTVLDESLAEFDRLLRDIQVALAPDREPAPAAPARPLPPAPPEAQPEPKSEPPRGREGPLAEMLARARREARAPETEPPPAEPCRCRPELTEELSALGGLRASLEELRASLGELLAGYQGALIRALAAPVAQPARPPVGNEFTVVAGPFVRLEAVRAFERSLLTLPDIERAAVRGYEGADRAVLDVRLAEPNS